MGQRLGGLIVVLAVLAAGVLLGSALSQWWGPSGADVPALEPGPQGLGRVRVEVLNGGGRANMARMATDRLRDRGFDVVYFGNARETGRDSSVVLDRVGRLEAARAVADELGVREVRSQPDSNLYLDVTVVLGSTWEPDPGTGTSTASADSTPWWDPRRWGRN